MKPENFINKTKNGSLANYSSESIRRGLDLAKSIETSPPHHTQEKEQRRNSWKCIQEIPSISNFNSEYGLSWALFGKHQTTAVSPDGRLVVGVNSEGEIRAFDLKTEDLVLLECKYPVERGNGYYYIDISANHEIICLSNEMIEKWDIKSQNFSYEKFPVDFSYGYKTHIDPRERLISHEKNYGEINCISLCSGERTCEIATGLLSFDCISVNLAANKVAVSGYRLVDIELGRYNKDEYVFFRHSIEIWDFKKGKLILDLEEQIDFTPFNDDCDMTGYVDETYVLFSPDGKNLISLRDYSNEESSKIKVWDLNTSEPLYTLLDHERKMAITWNRKLIYISNNKTIKIRSLDTGGLLSEIPYSSATCFTVTDYSKNPLLIIGYENGDIDIWDANQGGLLQKLVEHESSISSITANVSGSSIVSIDSKGKTIIWSSD